MTICNHVALSGANTTIISCTGNLHNNVSLLTIVCLMTKFMDYDWFK